MGILGVAAFVAWRRAVGRERDLEGYIDEYSQMSPFCCDCCGFCGECEPEDFCEDCYYG